MRSHVANSIMRFHSIIEVNESGKAEFTIFSWGKDCLFMPHLQDSFNHAFSLAISLRTPNTCKFLTDCNGQQKPDAHLGSVVKKFPLEFDRGLIAQCRVWSAAVIKSQIIDYAQFRCCFGFKFFVVELFIFQAAKKSFGWRIIPTIAFAAHALFHAHYH